ncbi:MAG: DNA replication protein, partial [Marinisporobacter sp.]|nr:DNA replication protein [Marinisporobacter sp.]
MKNLTDSSKNREYDCPKCKDREMIYNPKLDAMVFCECRERKEYERILENSRISEAFRQKTLKDYKVTNGVTRKARGMAFDYATEFNGEGSIGFLGQVGAGKTHLS